MFRPAVLARMENPDQSAWAADERSGVGAFGDIATQAGQCQIGRSGGATLFTADDVIHMEGEMRVVLMNQAIFAKAARPLENEAAQAG